MRGFGLRRGAIAGTVAHDHHNLMVVGTNPEDMLVAVEALVRAQGGFVAVEGGEVRALLSLPLWELMSDRALPEVNRKLAGVRTAARALGSSLPAPFTSLLRKPSASCQSSCLAPCPMVVDLTPRRASQQAPLNPDPLTRL